MRSYRLGVNYSDSYESRIFALFSRGLVGGVCCEKTIFIAFLLISRLFRDFVSGNPKNRIRTQTLRARVEIRDVQARRVPRPILDGLRDWT